MSAIWRRLEEKEEGFTLIELLVVVIIIGILAAIAIPVFLNQRESAWRSSVESDLRNAAIDIETYYTENQEYPTDAGPGLTGGTEVDVQVSNGTADWTYTVGGEAYCVEAGHENIGATGDIVGVYDSAGGGLVDDADCAAAGY